MKNKILAICVAITLLAITVIGGTIAYFTDTDEAVNVMTLGSVKIEQIEKEWNEDKTKLVDFTQFKEFYPYVGNFGWAHTDYEDGAYRTFTMENVIDKYVSVKNTGKSDAFVRTFIALEMGEYDYDTFNMVGVSLNAADGAEFKFDGTWEWEDSFAAEIEGNNYYVMVAVHEKALKPGETTIPSLLQVYLSKDATNEVAEKLDGNDNGYYEVLAFTEAVQTAGFTDAKNALETAFYKPDSNAHPWVDGINEFSIVKNEAELIDAFAEGGKILLFNDITLSNTETVIEKDVQIYLNGHTISADRNYIEGAVQTTASISTLLISGDDTDVVICGEGGVVNTAVTGAYAISIYDGATLTTKNGNYISYYDAIYVKNGELYVEGGFFQATEHTNPGYDWPQNGSPTCHMSTAINCYKPAFSNYWENRDGEIEGEYAKVVMTGGTLVNDDPSAIFEGNYADISYLPEGYKVVSENKGTEIWYTVVEE